MIFTSWLLYWKKKILINKMIALYVKSWKEKKKKKKGGKLQLPCDAWSYASFHLKLILTLRQQDWIPQFW